LVNLLILIKTLDSNSSKNNSEKSPYEILGVKEGAAFEDIQKARDLKVKEAGEDLILKAKIESSFDQLLMGSLKARQSGNVSYEAVSASKKENQINQLNNDEKENFMKVMGIKTTGLNNLINKGYKLLELNTFFTSGPEESRAWTIEKDSLAPTAAGKIHTDFEKGFIRAETVSYDDFLDNDGWVNSKNNGKMRLEGKDYIVKDGDILNIRFNS